MTTFKHRDSSLLAIVAEATGPDNINEAFCFVVGYLEAEIKHRQARLFDGEWGMDEDAAILHKRWEGRLAQLGAAWDAFIKATPEVSDQSPAKREGIAAQVNNTGKALAAKKKR